MGYICINAAKRAGTEISHFEGPHNSKDWLWKAATEIPSSLPMLIPPSPRPRACGRSTGRGRAGASGPRSLWVPVRPPGPREPPGAPGALQRPPRWQAPFLPSLPHPPHGRRPWIKGLIPLRAENADLHPLALKHGTEKP